MEELKPCPFCGGEEIMFEWEANYVSAFCEKCGSRAAFKTSLEEAAASWNARTERTCKQVITEHNDGMMPPFIVHCSECGAQWGYTPNYCPNCGVKVVG